jgi:hypothetical protein
MTQDTAKSVRTAATHPSQDGSSNVAGRVQEDVAETADMVMNLDCARRPSTSTSAGCGRRRRRVSHSSRAAEAVRTFVVELGQHSIRVNSVHPTHVDTPLLMNEAQLARLEGRVALDELLNRWPEWDIDYDTAELTPTSTVRAWERLRVVLP